MKAWPEPIRREIELKQAIIEIGVSVWIWWVEREGKEISNNSNFSVRIRPRSSEMLREVIGDMGRTEGIGSSWLHDGYQIAPFIFSIVN